jgi:hypothetical protein
MAPQLGRFGALRAGRFAFAQSTLNSYNWGMTTEQFRATLHRQPFRQFTIRMADGRAFEVGHRDFVALSHSGRTAIVFQPDESYGVLDLLLMSELQVSASNGHAD